MSITINFSPADMALIEAQASANNTTAEEFIRNASAKAARNAAYLAKLDHAAQQVKQGNVVYKTFDELEAMAK